MYREYSPQSSQINMTISEKSARYKTVLSLDGKMMNPCKV